jgi:phospholipid/cholesterol/gamma-HCH transport system permease protein
MINQSQPHASWEIKQTPQGDCIYLSGQWNLLTRLKEKREVVKRFNTLPPPQQLSWDLQDIEILDSEGALVLWHTWGETLPKNLTCRPDQRHWFERLEHLPPMQRPPPWSLWQPFELLGRQLVEIANNTIQMLLLIGQLMLDFLYSLAHPRLIPWKEISASIYKIGASSMLLLGVIGVLIGSVMTFQIAKSLMHFGANTLVVKLLGLSLLRELAPLAVSLIIMGRNGSAITAGIGAMQLTEEIAALRAFGTSPTQRLVLPKMIAMAMSIPMLVVWTDFMSIVGGMLMADYSLNIGYRLFMQHLMEDVPWVNFWIGVIKGIFFGLLIATVSSYFGLKIRANTISLSDETTNAVVTGLAAIIVIDAVSGTLLTDVGLY